MEKGESRTGGGHMLHEGQGQGEILAGYDQGR